MFVRILIACMLVSSVPGQLEAQVTGGERKGGIAVGGSVGMYGFLNGSSIGGSVHIAPGLPRSSAALDVWVASPAGSGDLLIGIDGGGIAITRGNPGFFLKGGVGLLVSSGLTGPGIHVGLGVLVKSGGLGVRLAGTLRGYTPDGGVPVSSFELGLMRLARREQ